jgi:hypothetical protein
MGQRVHEEGGSERLAVTAEIGVAPGCATWLHHPTRKRADFSLVSQHERA